VSDPLHDARTRLEAAVEAFRRVASKAIDTAAKSKVSRTEIDEARIQATYALASIGAMFKAALAAARPGAEDPLPPR
jgi:hypothetical protein